LGCSIPVNSKLVIYAEFESVARAMIIGLGTKADPNSLDLFTKDRQRIPNTQRKEHPPARMNAAKDLWQARFPSIKVRSLSATYDCVGMALASRRTAIGAEYLRMVLDGDGFKQVRHRSDVVEGDLIVYRKSPEGEMEHVGVVWSIRRCLARGEIEFGCLSQWGQDGEFIHGEATVPSEFGVHREFWSERKCPKEETVLP
jgi:hypothetical protein